MAQPAGDDTTGNTTGSSVKVGVAGASGFVGSEILRLLVAHPEFDLVAASGGTQAGRQLAAVHPHLAAAYPHVSLVATEAGQFESCDLVFCALPHGVSQTLVPGLLDVVDHVLDMGADFRLKDPALYDEWYGTPHTVPELLAQATYGLPELFREEIGGARLIALPGCFPTSATLAIAPFVRAGLIETSGVVVNSATGVSGAGRPPKDHTTFCAVDSSVTAYGLLDHRHTPEIEQACGLDPVLFTPHLVPMNRGILSTCTMTPTAGLDSAGALDVLASAYEDDEFIVVAERSPGTKDVLGANTAHLTARVSPRTGHLISICAIDNLTRGTAGQAIQCANLVRGLPEGLGLPTAGLAP